MISCNSCCPSKADLYTITLLILHLSALISSQGEGVPLLSGEKKEIEELLPSSTSDEDKETIFSILGQAMCRPAGIQVNGKLLTLQ